MPWADRLENVTQAMRRVSSITDPQEMVQVYGSWVQSIRPIDRFVSLSRRDLARPYYRITRSGLWEEQGRAINPWLERTPIHDGGLLGDLIYADRATIVHDFDCPSDDPACEHLAGFRSIMAIPLFENGVAVNMIVMLQREPNRFDPEVLAERVWMSNLFGRATQNLVLNAKLQAAYAALDAELNVIADIQRSLLPRELPKIAGVDFATHYETSTQAGGDYYDFFDLPDGRLGILIADVSGHGSPAAVMVAVAHAIAHTRDDPPAPPCELLSFLNQRLCARYLNNGTFITAFYGIYDPTDRTLSYCNAGHNPPIIRPGDGRGPTRLLHDNAGLPLGIIADERYADGQVTIDAGDVLVLYTDGVTESRRADTVDVVAGEPGELFGVERLAGVVTHCIPDARAVVDRTMKAVNTWTDFASPRDDRTLVVARFA